MRWAATSALDHTSCHVCLGWASLPFLFRFFILSLTPKKRIWSTERLPCSPLGPVAPWLPRLTDHHGALPPTPPSGKTQSSETAAAQRLQRPAPPSPTSLGSRTSSPPPLYLAGHGNQQTDLRRFPRSTAPSPSAHLSVGCGSWRPADSPHQLAVLMPSATRCTSPPLTNLAWASSLIQQLTSTGSTSPTIAPGSQLRSFHSDCKCSERPILFSKYSRA